MSITKGDLVYVAVLCTKHPECGRDFGLMFKVRTAISGAVGACCNHCTKEFPPGTWLALHPDHEACGPSSINGWIPFPFLKKINPPGAVTKQREPEKETA